MTRSIHQEMQASAFLPRTAAPIPIRSAAAPLIAAVKSPIRILKESPARVRKSISLPIQSVPKMWAAEGAWFRLKKSVSIAASVNRMPHTVTAASTTVATAARIFAFCL